MWEETKTAANHMAVLCTRQTDFVIEKVEHFSLYKDATTDVDKLPLLQQHAFN